MKTKTWIKAFTAAALVAAMTAFSGTAMAGNVENLERERAILIDTMLNADLSPPNARPKSRRPNAGWWTWNAWFCATTA